MTSIEDEKSHEKSKTSLVSKSNTILSSSKKLENDKPKSKPIPAYSSFQRKLKTMDIQTKRAKALWEYNIQKLKKKVRRGVSHRAGLVSISLE